MRKWHSITDIVIEDINTIRIGKPIYDALQILSVDRFNYCGVWPLVGAWVHPRRGQILWQVSQPPWPRFSRDPPRVQANNIGLEALLHIWRRSKCAVNRHLDLCERNAILKSSVMDNMPVFQKAWLSIAIGGGLWYISNRFPSPLYLIQPPHEE